MYYRVSTGYGHDTSEYWFSLKHLVFWFYDQLYYIAHAINGECMITILIANYDHYELALATTSQLGTLIFCQ